MEVIKSQNPKCPLRLVNPTLTFDPERDKAFISLRSPLAYLSKSIKQEAYEVRLYWEYIRTSELDGQTFYYTLTYNDKNLPSYLGQPCFDYEDIRTLLNGAFPKHLKRHYGSRLKYFVGAELGEGAGSRGYHNNPHYHCLFFITPDESSGVPYKKILPEALRSLIRCYWQGFDEDYDKTQGVYHDYRDAKFGIAKEGDHLGLVQGTSAITYVSKYVTKDVTLKRFETDVENHWRMHFQNEYSSRPCSYLDFFHEVLCPRYNLLNEDGSWELDDESLIFMLNEDGYNNYDSHLFWEQDFGTEVLPTLIWDYLLKHDVEFSEYQDFVSDYIESQVHDKLCEYRNRYCNKCRISQGVGDAGLLHITDGSVPRIPINLGNEFYKERPLSLYYYRKLYTDVVKNENGNNKYVLNAEGIAYKIRRLGDDVKKLSEDTMSIFKCVTEDRSLYDSVMSSDVNVQFKLPYELLDGVLHRALDFVHGDESQLYQRYAIYKLVYKDRFFKIDVESGEVPPIDLSTDYERFLSPSEGDTRYFHLGSVGFLKNKPDEFDPYIFHPFFCGLDSFFTLCDIISDYFFVIEDDEKEKIAEAVRLAKRSHVLLDLEDFLKRL